MAQPIPKWYEVDGQGNESVALSWSVGTVDAGNFSNEKEFYIWNNKGGGTPVSDMTNVFITTKHTDGTDSGLISGSDANARAGVVEVKTFDGFSFSEWQEIYGSTVTVGIINASGEVGLIRGDANDGNRNTEITKKNFARVKLRLHVYDWAPAGAISWKTRVSYQYT